MTTPALDLPDFDGPALCAEVDPELFFPDKGGSTRQAKKVCAACTITDQCLLWALENDEKFGVWGGLAEHERRALRGHRKPGPHPDNPINHGTEGGYKAHRRRGEQACIACTEGNRIAHIEQRALRQGGAA